MNDIDELIQLVKGFFSTHCEHCNKRTQDWFKTPNPMLGGNCPQDLLDVDFDGRKTKKILDFVKTSLDENVRDE